MSDQSVFSRISHWFKPASARPSDASQLPLEEGCATLSGPESERPQTIAVTTFLKPWSKRDSALVQLQDGVSTLNDLMTSIKANLDRQAERQDELLRVLEHLPEALRAIPENARVQAETLRAVGEQLQRHNGHYHRLGDVLEKVCDAGIDQRKLLDALHERVDTISQHDRALVDHMRSVSAAMAGVSQNTQTSAQVLDQLKNNARGRDLDLQLVLQRQGARFTLMLSVAILLSLAALAAVCLIGWKPLG
ncbi:MAG TPA: hypothetical protein VH475_00060 [Tepidisphaeraceae bacterium]|jgi:DNA repair ATPase RecN